ncbi:MAG: hypothetical protein HQL13_01150 [Candidatus Omnitrophica bacterium]|nr:hypothetical protein [Candidatus Omnitrophota bacterium]
MPLVVLLVVEASVIWEGLLVLVQGVEHLELPAVKEVYVMIQGLVVVRKAYVIVKGIIVPHLLVRVVDVVNRLV